MMTAATCGTGALLRSDVAACITHLRAFAIMLVGDRPRADDLVRQTIEQTFTALNRPPAGVDLKIQTFAFLHGLHFGSLRPSIEESAQQDESPPNKKNGFESDELLRIFGRLRDERREASILTIASGLSYQRAAEVCGCRIAVIKSRVSEAWLDISLALQRRRQIRQPHIFRFNTSCNSGASPHRPTQQNALLVLPSASSLWRLEEDDPRIDGQVGCREPQDP
jgi:RNA polymerase sigma-70 factor (ECF subfamily)